ncbi:hypothetical protein FVF58_40875 [Paraburkholderia panacisoli]|uniref:LysR substrate-binding domain-containing protein n=1 Tax=Paraburkholderia panacisoli TaxID=2603818 RepID=A0A5B0G9L4_9BURK|nr:LysR substrate-binding domain-containing protein [Paraburkholderia panacisoli]KAA0999962.1 hypothetical protein FVF58_40875 [Paraburkholderia panacisoli]
MFVDSASHLEARLSVRLLNRNTRSVSLTEAAQAYLSRIGPALSDVLEAGEQLHELQGRPSGVLRINAARISTAMLVQPLLAGFLKAYPDVHVELTNDEGYVAIVERGFDAGIRMGEGVQKNMIAVPLGGPVAVSIVGSPHYFKQHPVPRHPSDLIHHNCVRVRFSGSGAIYKWELPFFLDAPPGVRHFRGDSSNCVRSLSNIWCSSSQRMSRFRRTLRLYRRSAAPNMSASPSAMPHIECVISSLLVVPDLRQATT